MNGNDQEDIQVPIVVTKDQLNRMEDRILYRQVKSVKAGQIERFKINFTPQLKDDEIMIPPTLWLKIKNVEPLSKRAIYLGMYTCLVHISCDVLHTNNIFLQQLVLIFYMLIVDCWIIIKMINVL